MNTKPESQTTPTLAEAIENCFARAHPAYENDFGGEEIWHVRPNTLKKCLLRMAEELEALKCQKKQ